jgi:hypothetical protein
MLDAFIIDELRRKQQQRRNDDERPVLEIPVPNEPDTTEQQKAPPNDTDRGVAEVDFTVCSVR